MASCQDLEVVGRSKSKDYQSLLAKCLKNRDGTCLACQKLIDINRKIEDARRAFDSLLEERDAMASTLNEHHDPFLNRLPIEVVSHIFVQCRPVDPSVYTSSRQISERDLIKAIFTPCHISRNWRNIAFSTPELWSIFCTTVTRRISYSSIQITRQWLERSGVLPLFIQLHINSQTDDGAPFPDAAQQVVELVAQHAQRCDTLDLELFGTGFPQIFPTTKCLGLLQHLKVGIYATYEPRQHISAAPRLLTLRGDSWDDISTGSISWRNLTQVDAEIMCPDDLLDLLSLAPCLSVCSITRIEYLEFSTTGSPIYCPSLHTLIIGIPPHDFWDNHTFPSLDILRISEPYHGHVGGWGSMLAHLGRSHCKLRELEVTQHKNFSHQAQLLDVLKLLPDLEVLTVGGSVIDDPFFSLLDAVAISTTAGFLDKLKSLTCTTERDVFDYSELIGFLTTINCHQNRSLQSFAFHYDSWSSDPAPLDEDTFRRLLGAVQGLDFKLLDFLNRDMLDKLRILHRV